MTHGADGVDLETGGPKPLHEVVATGPKRPLAVRFELNEVTPQMIAAAACLVGLPFRGFLGAAVRSYYESSQARRTLIGEPAPTDRDFCYDAFYKTVVDDLSADGFADCLKWYRCELLQEFS